MDNLLKRLEQNAAELAAIQKEARGLRAEFAYGLPEQMGLPDMEAVIEFLGTLPKHGLHSYSAPVAKPAKGKKVKKKVPSDAQGSLAEKRANALALLQAGASISQTAKKTGLSPSTVFTVKKKAGLVKTTAAAKKAA